MNVENMKVSYPALLLLSLALIGCTKSQPPSSATATPVQSLPAVTVDPNTTGSVTGTIMFKGPQPKVTTLDMSQDPGCPSKPQPSEVFVMKDGKLANVFVYVKEGLPQGRFQPPSDPVVLDQKGCRYIPHMLGVMAGQPLKILNT